MVEEHVRNVDRHSSSLPKDTPEEQRRKVEEAAQPKRNVSQDIKDKLHNFSVKKKQTTDEDDDESSDVESDESVTEPPPPPAIAMYQMWDDEELDANARSVQYIHNESNNSPMEQHDFLPHDDELPGDDTNSDKSTPDRSDSDSEAHSDGSLTWSLEEFLGTPNSGKSAETPDRRGAPPEIVPDNDDDDDDDDESSFTQSLANRETPTSLLGTNRPQPPRPVEATPSPPAHPSTEDKSAPHQGNTATPSVPQFVNANDESDESGETRQPYQNVADVLSTLFPGQNNTNLSRAISPQELDEVDISTVDNGGFHRGQVSNLIGYLRLSVNLYNDHIDQLQQQIETLAQKLVASDKDKMHRLSEVRDSVSRQDYEKLSRSHEQLQQEANNLRRQLGWEPKDYTTESEPAEESTRELSFGPALRRN